MPKLIHEKNQGDKKKLKTTGDVWGKVDQRVKGLDQQTMKQYLTVFMTGLMVIVIVVFLFKKWVFGS